MKCYISWTAVTNSIVMNHNQSDLDQTSGAKFPKNDFKYDSTTQIELKYFLRKCRQLNEMKMLSHDVSIEFNKERNIEKA